MRRGVRLALDLGGVRTGVARCDSSAVLTSPMAVWRAATADALTPLLKQALEAEEVLEIVVGLPTDLRGAESLAAVQVRETVKALAIAFPYVGFRLFDERLTTAAARKQLQSAGYTTRTDKSLIDAAAAAVLLEDALEAERRQGTPPGTVIFGADLDQSGVETP